jgi:hypothetical protein
LLQSHRTARHLIFQLPLDESLCLYSDRFIRIIICQGNNRRTSCTSSSF